MNAQESEEGDVRAAFRILGLLVSADIRLAGFEHPAHPCSPRVAAGAADPRLVTLSES